MSNSKSFDNSILIFDSLASTNSYALQLIKEKQAKDKQVIVANYQTAGRGQREKKWQAEAGKSLLFSRIDLNYSSIDQQFYRSKCIALGIKSLIDSLAVSDCSIKWPNDILIGDKKIAGILIENSIEGTFVKSSIIGVGLNVNQEKFEHFDREATSLKKCTNQSFDCIQVLKDLLAHFKNWEEKLASGNFQAIDSAYQKALYGFGKTLNFKQENRLFKAEIINCNQRGELILLEEGIEKAYQMHQLQFID